MKSPDHLSPERISRWISPLRYPGGKVKLSRFLAQAFLQQAGGPLEVEVWFEPFAGGAGAGLTLLDCDVVSEFWMAEKNPAIASLWRTILHDGESFASLVRRTLPNMALWHKSRETLKAVLDGNAGIAEMDVALSTLIVNRCSRSGIMAPNVGPIGGKAQAGKWRLGARFNPNALAERIKHVHSMRHRVRLIEGDGIDHIAGLEGSGIEDEVFLFVDPPYIQEGNGLYHEGMAPDDHRRLASALRSSGARWMLTYDPDPLVGELYPSEATLRFSMSHTANRQGVGKELLIFSEDVNIPRIEKVTSTGEHEWVQAEREGQGSRFA